MGRRDGLRRRTLLAAVGAGSVAPLGGCPCGHVPSYDDRLAVAVESVERVGGGFRIEVRVTNAAPEQPGTARREQLGTTYGGVALLAYDADRSRVARTPLGDLPPGTVRKRAVRTAGFPLVVTVDAASAESEGECYFAETGAEIRGYRGRFEGDGPDGRTGHVWSRLRSRRLDGPLPPRAGLFESLRCTHRADAQVADRPTPDLSLVPGAEEWAGEPIPEPTVRHVFQFNAGRPASETDRERYSPDRLVPFDRCPPAVRERVRGVRYDQWIDRTAFLEGVSALAGREIRSPDDLPGCRDGHVFCNDSRGVKCGDGSAAFGGSLGKYVWFFTRYEGTLYPVVACFRERWLPPGAPDELPPCSDELEESFGVYAIHDVKHAHERRAEAVPRWVREFVRGLEFGQGRSSVPRRRWLETVRVMQGRSEAARPTCDWPNVVCSVDEDVHCGTGSREVILWAVVDDVRWSIQFEYEWRRLPE